MITPAAQRAIEQGLAFLEHNQLPDGAFGTGVYRGNVAVTSLAGLAMMSAPPTRAARMRFPAVSTLVA
jgi:hypothetical protein